MNQIEKQRIEIVEYNDDLAGAVAEMWNDSRDGWGGDSQKTTAEKVQTQEANSSNLHLFLAKEGEKVIGYCSLSEYREDEGALYIPLLNVRPDYHGKKIGKMLVQKAIERTVALGWPRLDLYTWPGNTKAVPLYKKCGFFWEDRDDTTHLLNFMPTVLQTEAVSEFFEQTNWYDSSSRIIEVKPDGIKENDFTFYQYSWENEGNRLSMEFERTSRGLRLIETAEYLIRARIDHFSLVAGNDYKITYDIENKSKHPLKISFEGVNHKEIMFDFKKTITVSDSLSLDAIFHLGEIDEEQSNWRTHPSVITKLSINGKSAVFKLGVLPKKPAKISPTLQGRQCYIDKRATFYLNIENNFTETAIFNFELPTTKMVDITQPSISVEVKGKEKVSLPIHYKLKEFGFYSPTIDIETVRESGITQTFTSKVSIGFSGLGAKFTGETEDFWHVYNGLYKMSLSKFDNDLIIDRITSNAPKTITMYPKLGKPYSSEFSKKRPKTVDFITNGNSVTIRALYNSTDFNNLNLTIVANLYSEGIMEQYYEISNSTGHHQCNEAWIIQPVYHQLNKPVFPIEHEIVKSDDPVQTKYGYWNSGKFTENWLFSRYSSYPHGICWPKEARLYFESWYFYLEHKVENLGVEEVVKTKPIFVSVGAYQTWQEFREFAIQTEENILSGTVEPVHFSVNDDNPICLSDHLLIKLRDYRTSPINGLIHVSTENEILFTKQYDKSLNISEISESVRNGSMKPIDMIHLHAKINGAQFKKSVVVLTSQSGGIVQYDTSEEDGKQVYTVHNGVIEFKAAPAFFPSIFSLKKDGVQWLDASYPSLSPKSWWNPWSGGIKSIFNDISNNSITKESSSAEFITTQDQHKNLWSGIKIETTYSSHEKYTGILVEQYFITLPGVPLLCHFSKVIQNTGHYLKDNKWLTDIYLKPSHKLERCWVKDESLHNDNYIFAGKGEYSVQHDDISGVGSTDQTDMLQVVVPNNIKNNETYLNKEVIMRQIGHKFDLKDGEVFTTAPIFFMINDELLPVSAFEQLKRISF